MMAYIFYKKALEAGIKLKWEFFQKSSLDNLIRVLQTGMSLTDYEFNQAEPMAADVAPILKEQVKAYLDLVRKCARIKN